MHFMLRKYTFICLFYQSIDIISRSFLRDLQRIYDDPLLMNTYSIGSAIASCFIRRVIFFDGIYFMWKIFFAFRNQILNCMNNMF